MEKVLDETLGAVLSLKNGLELVLTFLVLLQLLYLLFRVKRSGLFWAQVIFLSLLFFHFILLNAYHYFDTVIFSAFIFYLLYSPVLYGTFVLLKEQNLSPRQILNLGLVFLGGLSVFILSQFQGLLHLNSLYLCIILLYLTGASQNLKAGRQKIWFQSLCIYFIALVGIFPITELLISVEAYLYFKIPYALLFVTFLIHNSSFFLGNPKFFQGKISPSLPVYNPILSKKIEDAMMVKKLYRQNPFTLQHMSDELGEPTYLLSRFINQKYNKSFPEWINHYRIEDIKAQLLDPHNANLKIEALAYQAGFSTPSAFYLAFKKATGLTPTGFKKRQLKK